MRLFPLQALKVYIPWNASSSQIFPSYCYRACISAIIALFLSNEFFAFSLRVKLWWHFESKCIYCYWCLHCKHAFAHKLLANNNNIICAQIISAAIHAVVKLGRYTQAKTRDTNTTTWWQPMSSCNYDVINASNVYIKRDTQLTIRYAINCSKLAFLSAFSFHKYVAVFTVTVQYSSIEI